MALRIRTIRDSAEFQTAIGGIEHYFGGRRSSDDAERFGRLLPAERLHAAFDGEVIVGGAGVFRLELSIPGGRVPARESPWSGSCPHIAAAGYSRG
jgi:hypothetical protein